MASTLKTNAIEPEGATTNLVIGESGQNTIISNNDLRANVLQDAGGNAIFTSDGSGTLSGVISGFGGAEVLLSTQTASNSASLSFTSGITSTYKEYIFRFYNINPATDDSNFSFQVNATDGADYNDSLLTTTYFIAYHHESTDAILLTYRPEEDLAQSASFQIIVHQLGSGSDENATGEMHLFNPASTTYVKHFYSRMSNTQWNNYAMDNFMAGYINDTTAIDDIQFKMSSGNFDGKIKMYGVK